MLFTDFKFKPFINETLETIHFNTATPVQEKLIPITLEGRDIVGESKTGSGKTHTFLLPIFQKINTEIDGVQAVITAPSRELATQIYNAAMAFTQFDDSIKISNFVGGTDKKRQIEKLGSSQPHIVIGTPGRVMDLINAQALKTYTASIFVIDEADMTLDMGFLTEVDKIASTFDKKVQMLVFSATIPQKLQPFLKKYLNHPVMEKIATKTVISDTIDNWVFSTKGRGNNGAILEILQTLNPYLAMIFANTKDRADELHSFLTNNGFKVAKIHGGVPPRERKRIMKAVQNLDYQYVVATDLAARGIDIEGVSHIINDGIPRDLEFFVHRVGRTGRNGMGGTAITLYQPSDDAAILELEKTGIKFTPKVIKDGEIVDSYDRDRRKKREKSREALDITMIRLVKKKKKHIKPAYKKKIGWEIDKQKTAKKRIEGRAQGRSERKAKRQSF